MFARQSLFRLLTACLALSAAACSSDTPQSGTQPPATINENLVYLHPDGDGTALQPHQTVVVKRSSQESADGTRQQTLPYRILNDGWYKFCVPENDRHVDRVTLFDAANRELATWHKGAACNATRLTAGSYSVRIHHVVGDQEPFLFIKPQSVTPVAQSAKVAKKAAADYLDTIPDNQFVDQQKSDLNAILAYNSTNSLNEQWGLFGTLINGYVHFLYPGFEPQPLSYNSRPGSNLGISVEKTNSLATSNMLSFATNGSGITVARTDGKKLASYPVITGTEWICTNSDTCYNAFVGYPYYAMQDNTPTVFGLTPSGTSFSLTAPADSSLNPKFDSFMEDDSLGYDFCGSYSCYSSYNNTTPETFNIKVRTGTTSGTTLPALLSNEVALFDGCYGANGFSTTTNYWIINSSMTDFDEFAFNNPANKIKTVMTSRNIRALLYDTESYQGNSQSVSPPADSEMILTCSDSPQLANGAVASIHLEANTNQTQNFEFEHHLIISGNSCLGCDLRGFTPNQPKLTNADLTGSDLSNANFSSVSVETCTFTNALLQNANLKNATFTDCRFTGTQFSGAQLQGTSFQLTSSSNAASTPQLAWYNACPNFDGADLTALGGALDSVFPVTSDSGYNANTWWQNTKRCYTSAASATLSANLFTNKNLWQFISAPQANFNNQTLDGAVFNGTDLSGASFVGASLKNAEFIASSLNGTDFSGANLTGARLNNATITPLFKTNATTILLTTNLGGLNLDYADLSSLDLSGSSFIKGSYTTWDKQVMTYDKASLSSALLYNTKLGGVAMNGVDMTYVSWYGDGASGENGVFSEVLFEYANMPQVKLQKAALDGANFSNAVLLGAQFDGVTSFNGTIFMQADLRGADFGASTSLAGANLKGATISTNTTNQNAWVELMIAEPNQYDYFFKGYGATVVPQSSDGIGTCPNGFKSPAGDCGPVLVDSNGNLICNDPTYETCYWYPSLPIILPTCYVMSGPDPTKANQAGHDDQGREWSCSSSSRQHN